MKKRRIQSTAIQFHVRVPIALEKEGDIWVASCVPLDVVSQGATKEDATQNLAEAVSLFIETSHTMGTLDEVLTERGFAPVECGGEDMSENGTIDVPLPLLVARGHAQAHTG